MSKELTERQDRILQHIIRYVEERGFPPSIREIGNFVGIHSNRGVTVHLDALERKGYIKRSDTARSITVLQGDKNKALRDAAPDLLEACREAHAFICRSQSDRDFNDFEDVWHQAQGPQKKLKAAIRKANGI